MPNTFRGYITETLRKEVEVEAFNQEEALELIEKAHNDGEITLNYDDVVDIEISNCEFSKKEIQILNIIDDICKECINIKKCKPSCKILKIKNIIENDYINNEV